MWRIESPAWRTTAVPVSTCETLVPMMRLISCAACALRCASVRTSPATTAKPRPCSPARAASTAAFSARMLVWKAMPSMVPMMSLMRADELRMPSIVSTTVPITRPPSLAVAALSRASFDTSSVWAEVFFTVTEICSIAAADCCRLSADCSLRLDRSCMPSAISALECTMSWLAARTLLTM